MKRGLILVEGQTEERFVKDTLTPHFQPYGLNLTPTLLTTKVVKNGPNFKGGVTSFDKFEADMHRLLRGAGQNTLVTTMLDYYRLPDDFPGMASRPLPVNIFTRIRHVEQAIGNHFHDKRLLPFLALHEFEAWVFSCPTTLPQVMADLATQPQFACVCNQYPTPEQINEHPGQNPAARITNLFPAYRKTLHGPTATNRIGVQLIRDRCPHFHEWLTKLEADAKSEKGS